jgi:hypothetical protein
MERYNPAIFIRVESLIKAFEEASADNTDEVRLVIKDGLCIVRTYATDEQVGESSFKVLYYQQIFQKEGNEYRYPLHIFKELLSKISSFVKEREYTVYALIFFNEEFEKTEIFTEDRRFVIDYLNRTR